MQTPVLTSDELTRTNAYWRAANYLSVGQIYLYDNPLLKKPLKQTDVKPLVVGHWGTTPGQNFIYVHLNRVIKKYDLDMFYVAGPGHGGPALVGNTYLGRSCVTSFWRNTGLSTPTAHRTLATSLSLTPQRISVRPRALKKSTGTKKHIPAANR
jgi:phosphoketolase